MQKFSLLMSFARYTLFLGGVIALLACNSKEDLVYVDNARLMAESNLFSKVRDSLKAFEMNWKKEAEGLKDSVDSYMKFLEREGGGFTSKEKESRTLEFKKRQENLGRFIAAKKKMSGELENNLMQPALRRMNSYLQEYCESHGYKYILGTTSGGSILAARKDLDITSVLLKEMNASLK